MKHTNNDTRFSEGIRVIAFDADDTLWDCQSWFNHVEEQYCQLLEPWATPNEVSRQLFATECRNVPLTGYGAKAFTLSLVENAVTLTQGNIEAERLLKVQRLGLSLLSIPATPLEGVADALSYLRSQGCYKLAVFTKGEIQDQEGKLLRSGLWPLFDRVVVVADKKERQYRELCQLFSIGMEQLVMVGNSFKSDIEPVLQLGGRAIHIPFHTTWAHEQTDEYEHENLLVLNNIGEMTKLF
ncbi:MAG: HAD family hydrolase [Prevotella sp.]|nr:HAD family hydrolase [Prevotella sp.]